MILYDLVNMFILILVLSNKNYIRLFKLNIKVNLMKLKCKILNDHLKFQNIKKSHWQNADMKYQNKKYKKLQKWMVEM